MTYSFAMFGMPGHLELIIVVVVVLLLFGNRVPSIMRSLGKGVVEFKKGVQDISDDLDGIDDDTSKKSKDDDIA